METSNDELEAKISFLERSLEQLNEVVIGHSKTIDALKAEMRSLKEKSMQEKDSSIEDHDTPPPHY